MGTRYRTNLSEEPLRFVTTTFNRWLPLLKDESYFSIIANSLNFVSSKYNTDILAYVIMPNHLHLILFFSDAVKLSDYMRDFKKYTSGELRRKLIIEKQTEVLQKLEFPVGSNHYKIWMVRFDDFAIKNAETFHVKMNYIHQNPVRRNLSSTASE